MVGAYELRCLAAFNLIIHNIFGGIIYAPYKQKFARVHESIGDTIHSFFIPYSFTWTFDSANRVCNESQK